MAEDQGKPNEDQTPEDEKDQTSDSGLGNLPPLSDFDSGSGLSSDSGLPPLSSFESEGADKGGTQLPIDEGNMATPTPGEGSGFGSEQISSGSTPPLDTPSSNFQDMAADSDFSPETPEIGPGPESDVDTPMFDSAFGGGDAGFDASVDTPAPTQAMETPMFGDQQAPAQDSGFDPGAFGGGGGGFDQGGFDQGGFDAGGGTPMPDFSPDTGIGAAAGAGAGAAVAGGAPQPEKGGSGGGVKPLYVGVAALVALIIGLFLSPYVLPFIGMGGEDAGRISELEARVQTQQNTINQLRQAQAEGSTVSPQELDRIAQEIAQRQEELNSINSELESASTQYAQAETDLREIEDSIADLNEEFLTEREEFEDLRNQNSILQARQTGLVAEVDRLTSLVGELEDANTRRIATREALAAAVDRLFVEVSEGLPLTPEKFSHTERVRAVEMLRDRVQDATFVTPELMRAYTDVYVEELRIAGTREYFYARLPVRDRFGSRQTKWAEAVMVGNWGVYYRTLDGKNVGIFENVSDGPNTIWQFREEDLPATVKRTIEDEIVAMRPADWQDTVAVLAEEQLAQDERTDFQRVFDSL